MLARTLLLALLVSAPAMARTLQVGPDRDLKTPSAAAKVAEAGDVIEIDPGEYYDCTRVRTDRLSVVGVGSGVVLTDTTCDGKAIFVIDGNDVVLRNLTFQRARVADGNGAGIRAEGGNLTVEQSRFINNQSAIIAADLPQSTIRISDSVFSANGSCAGRSCASVLSVGRLARLRVEHSTFTDSKEGHQIVSGAVATELVGNHIADGPQGTSSYQLLVSDGGVLMEDNIVEKGPHSGNTRTAVLLDGTPPGPLVFRRNRFDNDTGTAMPFILNWTGATVQAEGDVVASGDEDVSSSGVLLHRARGVYGDAKQTAHDFVAGGYHAVLGVRHWLGGLLHH